MIIGILKCTKENLIAMVPQVVLKRGMSKGYSGIENPLFFHDKTKMLFGDAKDSIEGILSEIKSMD